MNDNEIAIVKAKQNELQAKQNNLSKVATKLWGLAPTVVTAVIDTSGIYKMSHGMFAGVPIVCRDDTCPYKDICLIDKSFRVVGSRCPMEASAIFARFEQWCDNFGIDISTNSIATGDLVDVTLIKDLVDLEVQILRAENKLALNADFIGKTISHVTPKGQAFYEDTVTPEAEFKLKLLERKHKILQLLDSTRKDKSSKTDGGDPSIKAVSIFKKVNQIIKDNNIDLDNIDFDDPVASKVVTEQQVIIINEE